MIRFKQFLAEIARLVNGKKLIISVKEDFPISIGAKSVSQAIQELSKLQSSEEIENTASIDKYRVVLDFLDKKFYLWPAEKALHPSIVLFFKIKKGRHSNYEIEFRNRIFHVNPTTDGFPAVPKELKQMVLTYFKGLKPKPIKIRFV